MLFLFAAFFLTTVQSEETIFEALGHQLNWKSNALHVCEMESRPVLNGGLVCISYPSIFLSPINVELYSRRPIVALFKDFLPPSLRQGVRNYSRNELEPQSEDDEFYHANVRNAEAGWMDRKSPLSQKLFQLAEAVLGLNMDSSEPINVISYERGGHFAPHADYLTLEGDDVVKTGNRVATFIMVAEAPPEKLGGATVFPKLNIKVHPEPGDAIFWVNLETDGLSAIKSVHGGCPVLGERKLIASAWIFERGQEFALRCPLKGWNYDFTSFHSGYLKYFQPFL